MASETPQELTIKKWLQRVALKVQAPVITPADLRNALQAAGATVTFAAAVDGGIKVWATGKTGLEIVAFFDLWECEDAGRDGIFWPYCQWVMA